MAPSSLIRIVVCNALILMFAAASVRAQGLLSPGVGPVNRSMAGASVAAPINGPGTLFFNPATMSGLKSTEVVIGAEIPYSQEKVYSSIPFVGAGDTTADIGVFPLAATSFIYKPKASPELTYGLGLFTAGGLFSNFPGDLSNPVLSPPPPNGFGVGRVFSILNLTQFIPAASYQANDRLSFGFSPIVTAATLQLDPVTLAPPDDANGDMVPSYPSGTGTHPHYGLGFQVGMFWKSETGLQAGFSYKSPNWLETIKINSQDEIGAPRNLRFDLDLPPVYSVGLAYAGFENWLFAADVRYIDYDTIPILSDSGFRPDLSLRGVGWESVVSFSLGISRQVNDHLALRTGWFVTENPIPDQVASSNVGTPAFYRNILSVGGSLQATELISWNLTYYYSLPSRIRGPIVTPTGAIPGSVVQNEFESHVLAISLQLTL